MLSYSGHQNSICCRDVSFPCDAALCVSYRWLWKAGWKILCPRHGVSFTAINHSKSRILGHECYPLPQSFIVCYINKTKAASHRTLEGLMQLKHHCEAELCCDNLLAVLHTSVVQGKRLKPLLFLSDRTFNPADYAEPTSTDESYGNSNTNTWNNTGSFEPDDGTSKWATLIQCALSFL